MAYYKLSEILECLNDYANEGIQYVEIEELEPDELSDDPDITSLCIDGIVDDTESIKEIIDCVTLPF